MTDFKVGDQIRLTVEGRVTSRPSSGDFSFDTGVDEWRIEGEEDYQIEVLPRTFGTATIVQGGGLAPLIRTKDGGWLNLNAPRPNGSFIRTSLTDADISRRLSEGTEVIYEPDEGDESDD